MDHTFCWKLSLLKYFVFVMSTNSDTKFIKNITSAVSQKLIFQPIVLDTIRSLYAEQFLSDFFYCLIHLLNWKNFIFVESIWNTIILIFFFL